MSNKLDQAKIMKLFLHKYRTEPVEKKTSDFCSTKLLHFLFAFDGRNQ